MGCQLLVALKYLSRMNGVHLGLGNIILEKANQFIRAIGLRCVNARIIDFGIALSLGENPDSVKGREEGKIIGSLGFIAPEQFRYPATVDHRADLYSLGCFLYFRLLGQPPFQQISRTNQLVQQAKCRIPAPHLVDPGIPLTINQIVSRMLDSDPAGRFQDPANAFELLLPLAESFEKEPSIVHSIKP